MSPSEAPLRVLFLAKDKPACLAALEATLDRDGVTVAAVVLPGEAAGLRDMAEERGLAVLPVSAFYEGRSDARDLLTSCDLAVSYLFPRIIREPLISGPRLGCLNFHPAPLPQFRGLGGINFAILEGLDEWGVTAHFVDEGCDTGDVIRVERFPIDSERETAWSLDMKAQAALLTLYEDVLEQAASGAGLPRRPQGPGRYIGREEFEAAKYVGEDEPIEAVRRKVRAFWYPPYEGAKVRVGGVPFTIVDQLVLAEAAAALGRTVEPPETL